MSAKKTMPTMPTMALCYDFDGTLSPKNMQEYQYIPNLAMTAEEFWRKSAARARECKADPILTYMKLMVEEATAMRQSITRKAFEDQGASVEPFPGVEEWFPLINKYAYKKRVKLSHYIISSGIKEMIEGTEIYKKGYFQAVYACSFMYDPNGVAEWPANVVNYTTKTQYLFRINKGVEDISDNESVNEFVPDSERPIPFSRMMYFGDGYSDVPCMKLVKNQGGRSIAVYNPRKRGHKDVALRLLDEGRVNFAAMADYRKDKDLFKYTAHVIDKVAAEFYISKMATPVEREAERRAKERGAEEAE